MSKKYIVILFLIFAPILSSEKNRARKNLKRSKSFATIARKPTVSFLLEIKEYNHSWDKPLWDACTISNISSCRLHLENGADPNYYHKGKTPLHIVCKKADLDIAELLLKYGASITVQNKKGKTPRDIAIEKDNNDIIELFLNHNSNHPNHSARFTAKKRFYQSKKKKKKL